MDDPNKVYRLLIKFMDEKYVDSFLNDGLLYMNNIEFFRNYEDADVALRGDRHEGLSASLKSEDVIIKIGDRIIDGAVGKIDIRQSHEDETNIYSMTRISDGKILESGEEGLFLSSKFNKFGNKAVLICDIFEFERRLKLAISQDERIYTAREDGIVARQVSYVSRDEHNDQMDVFNKFDEYSWQYEWRIAFKQISGTGPLSLKIGRLADIAQVIETESLISGPLELVPKN
ncbi:hypothetical protein [Vibrio cyclitrophicus]|uniref:hypothetical protein n=1 Tax=Vibrio cyclitrophicus TaxID=47951 RepID=UPI00148CAEF7|nr:hypothetical protein [Vibrio cyclitrophicus]NOH20169.1 hypothetical protein [Vibrio cyclitrophicus]